MCNILVDVEMIWPTWNAKHFLEQGFEAMPDVKLLIQFLLSVGRDVTFRMLARLHKRITLT
jgi:hypothetical protein